MGTYAPYLAGMIMGNDTTAPDWHLALYYEGLDPTSDIGSAEVTGSRTFVDGWVYTLPYVSNADTFYIGPLDACVVGGWFLVNGPDVVDVAWYGVFGGWEFPSPITFVQGDYLRFDPNTVNIGFDVVSYVNYPPADPPGVPDDPPQEG